MKIAFDASTLAFERMTGTGIYAKELLKAFHSQQNLFAEDHFAVCYRLSRYVRGRRHLWRPASWSTRVIVDPLTAPLGKSWDVFHGLNSRLPVLAGCKRIATVHDLFSIFGEFSKPEFLADQSAKLQKMIARADHVICPSTFTARELEKKMDFSSEKITVIPEGVRTSFINGPSREDARASVAKQWGVAKPYFLFVGTLEKRKNVVTLLKAFERFSRNETDVELIVIGAPGFEYDKIKTVYETSSARSRIHMLGFVNEQDLLTLYTGALAFVFLSLEEGFGIPVIEAMACGTAVLSSNVTSLPETGGGYTILVPPLDIEATASWMERIFKKDPQVEANRLKGQAYARSWTWERVAQLTHDVYASVVFG